MMHFFAVCTFKTPQHAVFKCCKGIKSPVVTIVSKDVAFSELTSIDAHLSQERAGKQRKTSNWAS